MISSRHRIAAAVGDTATRPRPRLPAFRIRGRLLNARDAVGTRGRPDQSERHGTLDPAGRATGQRISAKPRNVGDNAK
jgi:hypothetical protein